MRKLTFTLALLITLTGCSSIDPRDYTRNQPHFDLFAYFTGDIRGWGIVRDRNGKLLRQFSVDITGSFQDPETLVLDEQFVWNDGENEQRIWTITRLSEHEFSGVAADIHGTASGISYGNALQWTYQMDVTASGSTWRLTFSDWMFLQPDGVLLNVATMTKFGFEVGTVTIAFQKLADEAHP